MYRPWIICYRKHNNAFQFLLICETFKQNGPKYEYIYILYSFQGSNWGKMKCYVPFKQLVNLHLLKYSL